MLQILFYNKLCIDIYIVTRKSLNFFTEENLHFSDSNDKMNVARRIGKEKLF